MGGVVKAVKGVVNGPEQVKPTTAKKKYWDIASEVKPAQDAYAPLVQNSQAASTQVAPQRLDVLKQMGLAATGQGPSLAEAQMKAAQDRNLAQQLAAAQAQRGGNAALTQRNMLNNQASAGRDLAQQAGIARLQERDSFLNAANTADQALRTDIAGKLNLDLMPKQSLQSWESARVGAVNQAQAANAAAQNQMTGALIGGAATIGGGMATGGASLAAPAVASAASSGLKPTQYHGDGGMAGKWATGGKVEGPGTGTSDSIPAKLSNGEFVVKAKVAQNPAMLKFLEKINSEKATKKDVDALARVLMKQGKKDKA